MQGTTIQNFHDIYVRCERSNLWQIILQIQLMIILPRASQFTETFILLYSDAFLGGRISIGYVI